MGGIRRLSVDAAEPVATADRGYGIDRRTQVLELLEAVGGELTPAELQRVRELRRAHAVQFAAFPQEHQRARLTPAGIRYLPFPRLGAVPESESRGPRLDVFPNGFVSGGTPR